MYALQTYVCMDLALLPLILATRSRGCGASDVAFRLQWYPGCGIFVDGLAVWAVRPSLWMYVTCDLFGHWYSLGRAPVAYFEAARRLGEAPFVWMLPSAFEIVLDSEEKPCHRAARSRTSLFLAQRQVLQYFSGTMHIYIYVYIYIYIYVYKIDSTIYPVNLYIFNIFEYKFSLYIYIYR